MHSGKGINGESVDFDISVEVRNSSEKSGKTGIEVAVLDLGGAVKKAQSNQDVHRLKFRIFISEKELKK